MYKKLSELKSISFAKTFIFMALSTFAGSALAEYYVVYAPPAVYIEQPVPPPCVVKYVKVHYKKYRPKHHSCHSCYKKSSCNVSVYYPPCSPCGGCGPCNSGWVTTTTVTMPATPVYRPNTYHPSDEYAITPSMDMRTADDIFF